MSEKDRKYHYEHQEKRNRQSKENYYENKEHYNELSKKYYQEHAEEIKARKKKYREENADKIKAYREKVKEKTKTYLKDYTREKARSNPSYRLRRNLTNRIYIVLKNKADKKGRTMELTGCSLEDLMKHLESQFKEGMLWENYGKWHVDHIIPCSSFDLLNEEEQKKCFHYTNLQPLWQIENLKKSNKIA